MSSWATYCFRFKYLGMSIYNIHKGVGHTYYIIACIPANVQCCHIASGASRTHDSFHALILRAPIILLLAQNNIIKLCYKQMSKPNDYV